MAKHVKIVNLQGNFKVTAWQFIMRRGGGSVYFDIELIFCLNIAGAVIIRLRLVSQSKESVGQTQLFVSKIR